ncbi:MAG TPA: pitrilysin family protein [Candidatus Deferrimicrobiaceae bacterium]|jgi:predicted Zn-dependent peptidase
MTVEKTVLDNGVTVVSEQVPWMHSVAVGLWAPVGSRDEALADNGISHFIEHMLFKGTTRRGALDITREIESVGGSLNACTEREYTCFYGRALERDFPLVTDLLSDIYLDPVFDPDELEREKGVVLQEILMVDDTPEDLLDDFFQDRYWGGHSLGYPVQGTTDTVESFDREAVRRYFLDRYRRPGIVVSVAGKIPHDRVVDEWSRRLAPLALSGGPQVVEPVPAKPGIHMKERPLGQLHLCVGAPSVSLRSEERHVAYVLNTLLGGSMSSLLFQEVREKRGLAYSVYSSISCYSDSGILKIYAGTTADKGHEVLAVVADVLSQLREGKIEERDVLLARELIRGNLLMGLESGENRMTRIALNELFLGRQESPEDVLEKIDAVTVDHVAAFAKTMLAHDRFSVAAVGDIPAGRPLAL